MILSINTTIRVVVLIKKKQVKVLNLKEKKMIQIKKRIIKMKKHLIEKIMI